MPPAEGLRRFAVQQQEAELGVELLVGEAVKPAREGLMTLGGVVDDQKGSALPGEAVRGERFDDRAQICRRQKAGDPFAFAGRVAVDRPAEFDREPRLAGSGAPDQPIDRDIGLVVEPRLKLGEKVLAADQRQSAGLGDEKVEFARRLSRARSTAALGRRELLAAQWQA